LPPRMTNAERLAISKSSNSINGLCYRLSVGTVCL
jgi:hypothetical protein